MLKVDLLSIEIVKGFTKIQCIMFVLMACSDIAFSDEDSGAAEILKPLRQVLDKAWLIPVHAACLNSVTTKLFCILSDHTQGCKFAVWCRLFRLRLSYMIVMQTR